MHDFSRYREIIPYARYSSKKQSRGTSEERQLDAVEAFAKVHGLTLSTRVDRGLSGYHGDNLKTGALGSLIHDLNAGLIPTPALLLVERQDRFGRRPTTHTLLTLIGDLLRKGCDLYHLSQGRLYTEDGINSDFGQLVTLTSEIYSAHQFSSMLSQRSLVAHAKARERIKRGEAVRLGWAPIWLEHTSSGWQFTPYVSTIRRLLELVDSGSGYIATAKLLNHEGLLSPTGKAWTAGAVQSIVQSPAVAGGRTMRRRAEIAWDYFPAVMERNQWHALLHRITNRKADYTAPTNLDDCIFIGQGLTFCDCCGRMVGSRVCSFVMRSTGERVRRRYVRCRGRLDGDCKEPAIQLQDVVAHILTRLQPQQLRLVLEMNGNDRGAVLQRQVEEAEKQRDGAAAALAACEEQFQTLTVCGEAATALQYARQVPVLEERLRKAEAILQVAMNEREAHASTPVLDEIEEPLLAMQRSFALGKDTAQERVAINSCLRRLGVRITLRSTRRELGLSIGEGPTHWQPLMDLDRSALWEGVSGWNDGRDSALVVEPQLSQANERQTAT